MKRVFLMGALSLLCVFGLPSNAAADLLISPLQVVMEGRDRSTEIVLVNTGSSKNTYRLEWLQLEQATLSGGYQEEKETAAQTHLQDIAVFTPRQIVLLPREKQTIRIAVRRPADLADGEYKTHLTFKLVSSEEILSPDAAVLADDEFSAAAKVLSSYSIPIIYRVGAYDCQVKLGNPKFSTHESTGNVVITIPMQREGIHGVVGSAEMYFKPQGGEEALVSEVGNINFFPEITEREVKFYPYVTGMPPGEMRIVYKKAEGRKNEHSVMDERVFPIRN